MIGNENQSVTTILTGGTVCVDENTIAEAISICDGRVLCFGDRDEVLRQCPGAEEIDITGSVLAPGLIDTHPHMLHFALLQAPLVDLRKAKSWKDIVEAIRDRAKETSPGEWIMTTPVGDDEHYFIKESWRDPPEGALPDAATLDSATTAHPVIIQAWAPGNPNVAALNTAAIEKLGLNGPLPESDGQVSLERDSAARLTGRITGSVTNMYGTMNGSWAAIWNRIPFIQPQLLPGAMKEAMKQQNLKGVTTIYEGHCMDEAQIGVYKQLNHDGKLTVRVMSAPDVLSTLFFPDRKLDEEQLARDLDIATEVQGHFGDKFKVNGFCMVPTGPGYNGDMIMREPYRGPNGTLTEGRWVVEPELVETAMRWGKERGLRVNIGGGGLGENDVLLGLFDKLRDEGVLDGSEGWILQHGFFMDQTQAERYASHGLQATVCPGFTYGKSEMYAARMGEHGLEHLGAFRRMIDAGMDVAGSCDWGPRNPFKQMSIAVLHDMGKSGKRNDGPAQAITQREAYAMWGRHADLLLLDRDPVTCPIQELAGIKVTATFLSGRLVSGTIRGRF